jgi:TonB-dependent SusC/RagA subfamily outer membrane receptor
VVKQKNVYENDSKKDNYQSSNYGGAGHADQVIKGDAFKNAPSLSQGLSGLAAGVNFSNGMPYLPTNIVLSAGATVIEPMYVVLDGSQYTPAGEGINDINPNTVETVEILKGANASIYGMNGGAGVMIITTRHNGAVVTSDNTALGSLAFRPRGFYKAREFYSPKYENTTSGNDRRDLRSTIFWLPEIATNKDGNASFEYYNADGRGTYRVVIEGIDDKGNIGRQVYRYKIE